MVLAMVTVANAIIRAKFTTVATTVPRPCEAQTFRQIVIWIVWVINSRRTTTHVWATVARHLTASIVITTAIGVAVSNTFCTTVT
jgi:hypothetical protein